MKLTAGCAVLALFVLFALGTAPDLPAADTVNPNPPAQPVRLIFIHHSTGENWLADENGGLGIALRNNNYVVSDTNYDWGPACPDCQDCDSSHIGSCTDLGHWWEWFRSSRSPTYLAALYNETGQNCSYSRSAAAVSGENTIVLFKSCFPNSGLAGSPTAVPPPIAGNPLRGHGAGSDDHTVANAKSIYIDIRNYFQSRPDRLFIVVSAPPLSDPEYAANARAFNNWLVREWLQDYPLPNVAVFDFYNVLTTNGGSSDRNDLNQAAGNHHRLWTENYGKSELAKRFGVTRYPAIFIDDVLVAKPKDFGFFGKGEGKDEGRYAPWINAASHERFRADLKRMIDLVLAGRKDALRVERAGGESLAGAEKLPSLRLVDLGGKPISDADLAGRVVLVEFWATWCPPCRGTLEWLGRLKAAYGDRLVVLAAAMESNPEDVGKLVERLGLPLRWIMGTPALAQQFGDISAFPTLFLFDSTGNPVGI